MADYVERLVLRVNGVDLDDVINSVTETSERTTTPVNTMNKRRTARGFKQKNNMYSLEIDAERIVDPRVPDWHALKDAGANISVVTEPNIGPMVTYSGGKITRVVDGTSDGESSRRISAVFTTRK
jgi:hypothetical protein